LTLYFSFIVFFHFYSSETAEFLLLLPALVNQSSASSRYRQHPDPELGGYLQLSIDRRVTLYNKTWSTQIKQFPYVERISGLSSQIRPVRSVWSLEEN
jgi:hypothetical protein